MRRSQGRALTLLVAIGVVAASVGPADATEAPPLAALDLEWQDVSTDLSPPPAALAAMAYDPERREMISFGGYLTEYVLSDETWAWDGETWKLLHPEHRPPPQVGATMAYDARHDQLLMITGSAGWDQWPRRDTWLFHDGDWSLLESASAGSDSGFLIAYDRHERRLVRVSQLNYGETRTWIWDGKRWDEIYFENPPPARQQAGLAYSPSHKALVLFGGLPLSGPVASTWTLDGTGWTEETLQRSPKPRAGPAMTTLGRHVVSFGGDGKAGDLPGTWVLRANSWRKQHVDPAPSARAHAAMAWDSKRKEAVLFGGWANESTIGGTWTLTPKCVAEPATLTLIERRPMEGALMRNGHPRAAVALAVVLTSIASLGAAGAADAQTGVDPHSALSLEWRDVSTATAPPPMIGAAMAYDPSIDKTILFGGFRVDGFSDETWAWDGTDWAQLHPAHSPPAQNFATMAYDRRHRQLLMVTGYDEAAEEPRRDTWLFRDGDWSLVSTGSAGADNSYLLAYNRDRRELVCINQRNLGVTRQWTWDGSSWTERFFDDAPLSRDGAGFAYSPARKAVVLFGGETSTELLPGTWSFDGTAWTEEALLKEPKVRSGPAMATFGRHVVIFGGDSKASTGALPGTWVLKRQSWRKQQLAPAPPPRAYGHLAWDSAREEAVLFGGWSASRFDDTWVLER